MADYEIDGVSRQIKNDFKPASSVVQIPHINGSEEIGQSAPDQQEKAAEFQTRTVNTKGTFSVKV